MKMALSGLHFGMITLNVCEKWDVEAQVWKQEAAT